MGTSTSRDADQLDPPLRVDWIDREDLRDGHAGRLGLTFLPEISIGQEAMGDRVSLGRFADPEPSRLLGLAWRRSSPR